MGPYPGLKNPWIANQEALEGVSTPICSLIYNSVTLLGNFSHKPQSGGFEWYVCDPYCLVLDEIKSCREGFLGTQTSYVLYPNYIVSVANLSERLLSLPFKVRMSGLMLSCIRIWVVCNGSSPAIPSLDLALVDWGANRVNPWIKTANSHGLRHNFNSLTL